MTKVEFVARSMYGHKAVGEGGATMEKRAALAIEACEEWDRRERGLEEEARALREAWTARGCVPGPFVSPSRDAWINVARKAREIHGKEGV